MRKSTGSRTGSDRTGRGRQPRPRSYRFPRDFLWGAATASHQVEGGNRWNDWWAFEEAGRLPHASGDACRHWDLYEADFDRARHAAHNAHRFSIEWSRVQPTPGEWSTEAVEHYRDVIHALRSRGIEPVVTLQHFTLPTWVAERGGWSDRRSVECFARYAELVARELGEDVRYWLTVNEPTVYVKHAWIVGDWPPCRRRAWVAAARSFRNMARAHRAARDRIRAARPDASVGFAHSAPLLQPCDPTRALDRFAAWLRDLVLNRSFFLLLGRERGGRPFDFIGINYYTRTVVRGGSSGIIPFAGTECRSDHHADRGPFSDVGWEVYPDGLTETLRRFSRYGVPLLVTENGIATDDESLRTSFLVEHLARVGEALEEGVDVRGYLHWTLMDNFEWALGTTARFGLFGVDFATQERTARPALDRYRDVCETGLLSLDGVGSVPSDADGHHGGHAPMPELP